jgi:predicted metal-dependent hydrolase
MLQVRRVRFDFEDDVPFVWNPQNPAFSVYMNATSIIAIAFEKFVVAAVREAMPKITDAEAAAEAQAFLRQEAQHASAHRQHLRALIKRYPGLQQTLDDAIALYDELGESKPLPFRLAYIADLEATFTPFFKMMLDNEATFFRPGDDRIASLFLWHFVEEVEHRSSALVVYNAVVGSNAYRVRALPGVIKHLVGVWKVIADGFDTQVPRADRQIDARLLRPVAGAREALRRKLPFAGASGDQLLPMAFSGVPMRQRLATFRRVILSQTPHHDPAHQPLPEFAARWFARYEHGDDICHWYWSSRTDAVPEAPNAPAANGSHG